MGLLLIYFDNFYLLHSPPPPLVISIYGTLGNIKTQVATISSVRFPKMKTFYTECSTNNSLFINGYDERK